MDWLRYTISNFVYNTILFTTDEESELIDIIYNIQINISKLVEDSKGE